MKLSAARSKPRLACVLLAAGGSRRLGKPKQLVRHRGRSLLLHAVAAARGALPSSPLFVVVGADALRMRLALRRARCGAHVIKNPRWHEGMAASLRVGLAAVDDRCSAVLVLLVDQPLVDAAALARLVAAWRRRPAVAAAARYDGRVGAPAILPRKHWSTLRSLRGDEGARALLRGSAMLTLVDVPQAALDVDTHADLERLARGGDSTRLRRR